MAGSPSKAPDSLRERTPGPEAAERRHAGSSREARRAARAHWPVRKFRLGRDPGPDLSATTTAQERLAMMWPLAREAWTLAERTIPDYPRHRMPIRIIRPPAGRCVG